MGERFGDFCLEPTRTNAEMPFPPESSSAAGRSLGCPEGAFIPLFFGVCVVEPVAPIPGGFCSSLCPPAGLVPGPKEPLQGVSRLALADGAGRPPQPQDAPTPGSPWPSSPSCHHPHAFRDPGGQRAVPRCTCQDVLLRVREKCQTALAHTRTRTPVRVADTPTPSLHVAFQPQPLQSSSPWRSRWGGGGGCSRLDCSQCFSSPFSPFFKNCIYFALFFN